MTDATPHFNVHAFRNALVEWFRREGKDYPWRRTTDPWHILVSELMLQQTTIPTVLGRYDRWMRQFPTPGHLAAVDEQTALRSWEGLGYYRRVRSLQAIAREIVNKFGGRFPDNAEGLKRLPGIGPYTSGALLSSDLQHYPLQGDPLHPPCDGYASPQGKRGIRAAGQNPRAAHGISGPQGAELPRPGQTAGPYQMNDRLTPELVLSAYCQGCFPMADPETGEISFYEPDPRALIPLDDRFHIPHGLKRALNKKPFELRMDTAFPEVVHACARTEQPEEQWIDGQIEEAYGKLHEMGFAHSVECWDEEGLQGGLYGVALGKAFFGESMFHRKTDASKIALVALVQYLRAHQFLFLDTQWTTPHLLKFGTYEVPAEEYRKMLKRALAG